MSGGGRIRARLRREVRVWGLRAPAKVSAEGGVVRLEVEDVADADLVEGFGVAATAMLAMDLERRLWSGRLAEVVGDRVLEAGSSAGVLDPFVRILGFRADAERTFKALDRGERQRCEDYARGVNAWIDGARWPRDPRWAALGTRPRLWGAADSLLLARAPAVADLAGPTFASEPDAAVTEAEVETLTALWASLHGDSLRAPGAPGGGTNLEPTGRAGVPSRLAVPGIGCVGATLAALTADRARRLRARTTDIDVGGGDPRRLAVRRGPGGGVVSDLFDVGPRGGYLWRWEPGPERTAPASAPRTPLAPGHPWRLADPAPLAVAPTRLVPLEGGA